jgi:hypothetical protein
VIKLRLPDGRIYGQNGTLDYGSPTVGENTDTITVRGVIPNPVFPGMKAGMPGSRELIDGEFVTVLFEGVQPILVLAIKRVFGDRALDHRQRQRAECGIHCPHLEAVRRPRRCGEFGAGADRAGLRRRAAGPHGDCHPVRRAPVVYVAADAPMFVEASERRSSGGSPSFVCAGRRRDGL